MAQIRICDFSKQPISSEQSTLPVIIGEHKFEVSEESYKALLQYFQSEAVAALPMATQPNAQPPRPSKPIISEELAKQILQESKVRELGTLPALSNPKDRREAMEKLDAVEEQQYKAYKNHKSGRGLSVGIDYKGTNKRSDS